MKIKNNTHTYANIKLRLLSDYESDMKRFNEFWLAFSDCNDCSWDNIIASELFSIGVCGIDFAVSGSLQTIVQLVCLTRASRITHIHTRNGFQFNRDTSFSVIYHNQLSNVCKYRLSDHLIWSFFNQFSQYSKIK